MSIKTKWAKYLVESEAYQSLTQQDTYNSAWQEYLDKNKDTFIENDINFIGGNITVKAESMALEFVTLNLTEKPIKELVFEIKLGLNGKDYFHGTMRMNKNLYEELNPKEARIDLANFKNDRFDDGLYRPKDYTLEVLSCREVQYIEE